MLVISEFRPKIIIICDFWAKKLPNSRMVPFIGSKFEGKELLHLINSSRQVLILY